MLGLVLVAWVGVTLWRYQSVAPPSLVFRFILALLWLGLFTVSALGWGTSVLLLLLHWKTLDTWACLIALALGAAVLAAIAGVLGLLGALAPLPLALAFGGGLVAAVRWGRFFGWFTRAPIQGGWRAWLPVVPFACTLLAVPTLSPFYDSLNYHLGLPFQWLRVGRIFAFPRHAYSFLPATFSLLFTYPLALLGPWGAQAIHWWAGLLAALACGHIAGSLGGPRAGLLAATLFASAPVTMESSIWAAADLGAAVFGIAAWLPLLSSEKQTPSAKAWLLAGVLAGAACGSKILGLGTVLLPLLAAWVGFSPTKREMLRNGMVLALGVGVALGPWLLRSVVMTGDPFYPFGSWLVARLGGPSTGEARLAAQLAGAGSGGFDPVAVATLSTFSPKGSAGELGPAFFALLPLAAASFAPSGDRRGRVILWGAALGVLGWGVGPARARYLLPVLPLLAVALAYGWERLCQHLSLVARRGVAALVLFALVWSFSRGLTPLWWQQTEAGLGFAPAEEVLARYVSYWRVVNVVNEQLPPTAKLLLVAESRLYGWEREVETEDPFHEPLLEELAAEAPSAQALASRLRAMGITHVLVNWAEAQRIARMNGRAEYFAASGNRRKLVEDFFRNHASVVAEVEPTTIYRIR